MLLGSRLQSNEHVFAFILFAIELFAGFPIVQREVKVRHPSIHSAQLSCVAAWKPLTLSCLHIIEQRKSERAHLVTALIFFVLSVLLTWEISGPLCLVSSGAALFVTLVCPLWFMHVQEYKKYVAVRSHCNYWLLFSDSCVLWYHHSEILGPWDIAHIQPEQ